MRTLQLCLLALCTIAAVYADDPSTTPSTEPPTEAPPTESTASSTSEPTTQTATDAPVPSTSPSTLAPTPAPSPPTDLDVAHISSTSLLLRWKWTEEELTSSAAKFVVSATLEAGETKTMDVERKRYVVLDQLEAGKQYEISVALVKADGTTVPSDKKAVQLKDKDFIKPIELGNVPGDRTDDNVVPYTTTWNFDSTTFPDQTLTQFKVLRCTVECDEELADENKTDSVKNLYYYTDYTVLVIAVLQDKEKLTEVTEVSSSVSTFKTIMGKPGPVEKIQTLQINDTLDTEITWSLPNQPNGIVSSYNVQIFNGEKSVETGNPTETKYTHSIKTKEQLAFEFKVKIFAINKDTDGTVLNGGEANKDYSLVKPAPPTDLKQTGSKPDSIEFQIVTENQGANLVFDVKYGEDQKSLVAKTSLVELKDLKTYTNVSVSAAACVPLDGDNSVCGESKTATLLTNVDAPSQVRSLNYTESKGEVSLKWEAPETPKGPIDGYVVRISDKTKNELNEVDTKEPALSYTFKGAKNCTQYEFGVLAYNLDVLSGARVNGTISDTVTYTSTNCEEGAKGLPAWAIVLIVLAVLGAAGGGGAFYYFKMRRQ